MRCLIYNINNFCGNDKTLKDKNSTYDENERVKNRNSILDYILPRNFDIVALQEFPVNYDSGQDFIYKMKDKFDVFHNNDIVKYSSPDTSISIIFIKKGNNIIRKTIEDLINLRYVYVNVNGIDILNVHVSAGRTVFPVAAVEYYSRMHNGFIFGDFNAGLYLKNEGKITEFNYLPYKNILNNGFQDILAANGKEQVTYPNSKNPKAGTCIDHVLCKGVDHKSCKIGKRIKYSDHYPIILEY